MARRIFLVCLLVSCAALAQAQQLSSKELQVPANTCSTFILDSGSDKYSFNVTLGVASLNNCTNVTITKYFPDGACLNGDGTGNELTFAQLDCAKANGNSSQTCMNAFAQAKSDRKVNVSTLNQGSIIDSGNSCDKDSNGYIFIQNSCSAPVTVGIKFQYGSYSSDLPCLKVAGHSISGMGIAIIVLAAILVIISIIACIMCCCCR